MSPKYLPEHLRYSQTTLFAAQQACHMFFDVIQKVESEINRLGVRT